MEGRPHEAYNHRNEHSFGHVGRHRFGQPRRVTARSNDDRFGPALNLRTLTRACGLSISHRPQGFAALFSPLLVGQG